MTTYLELKRAVEIADSRFKHIKENYPNLEMYLVLSSNLGQTGLHSAFEDILEEFPQMIADGLEKTEVMNVFEKAKLNKQSLKDKLDGYADKISYNDDVNIEIRFKTINYELIWKLQKDELIDQQLTPQSKASIRIVLGTIGELSRHQETK